MGSAKEATVKEGLLQVVVMKFGGDGGVCGGIQPTARKEFLKLSLVQKSDFIKAWRQDPWAGKAVL